jgi:hypothetical protein
MYSVSRAFAANTSNAFARRLAGTMSMNSAMPCPHCDASNFPFPEAAYAPVLMFKNLVLRAVTMAAAFARYLEVSAFQYRVVS